MKYNLLHKAVSAFFVLFLFSPAVFSTGFITTWVTDDGTISMPLTVGSNDTVQYVNLTNPGTRESILTNRSGKIETTGLSSGDLYKVIVSGHQGSLSFISSSLATRLKIKSVEQWGDTKWLRLSNGFNSCENLQINAIDVPDLSECKDLSKMFYSCTSLTGHPSMNNWNTENVVYMKEMFKNATSFNQDIGDWNTSKVKWMGGMFRAKTNFGDTMAFNQDIGRWNTESVTDMSEMFWYAGYFNQDIGDWNTENVEDMSKMFWSATSFNQDIGSWNTKKVEDMSEMFEYARSFNQDIGDWFTDSVTDMSEMFSQTDVFNQDIGAWNTENVIDMDGMFSAARVFNQDIGAWNTGNVTNMSETFLGAHEFNQDIGDWNTEKVISMYHMFTYALVFNQDIGGWKTDNVKYMYSMFRNAQNFNQDITSWNTGRVIDMSRMFLEAESFNQDIGDWNTENVTRMGSMFSKAESFNQDISRWNTKKVTTMLSMFKNAKSFDQNLGGWELNALKDMDQMFDSTAMSCSSYSSTLIGWESNPNLAYLVDYSSNDNIQSGPQYGTNAIDARNRLISNKLWRIGGDTLSGQDCSLITSETSITQLTGSVLIYPNPAKGDVVVKANSAILSVKVFDQEGRVVYTNSSSMGLMQKQLIFDTNGVFIIEVETSQETKRSRIVIMK